MITIKVLQPDTYMNLALKAQKCQSGDILTTQSWYGEMMVREKFGEEIQPEPAPKIKPVKAKKEKTPKAVSAVINPFLE